MHKTVALFFLLSTLALSARAEDTPAQAPVLPSPDQMQRMQGLNPMTSVFAFVGTTCPGGSEPYKGPEQALVADSGVMYCVLRKKVSIYPKKMMSACPMGSKAYSGKGKPDDDVIWCESDASFKMKPHKMPDAKVSAPASPAALAPASPPLVAPSPEKTPAILPPTPPPPIPKSE